MQYSLCKKRYQNKKLSENEGKMTFDVIFDKLSKDKDLDQCISKKIQFSCNFFVVDKDHFKSIIEILKKDFAFDYLVDIVAVHWPERKEKFDIIYNLYSMQHNLRIFVKVKSVDENIETLTDIYKGANFLEREQFDMFGINFIGHPDLRRILMPDFFDKHPLRKDYDLKDRSWFNDVDEQGLGIKYKGL